MPPCVADVRPFDIAPGVAAALANFALPDRLPLFFEAIDAVVVACADFIPRESGRSLYLRPFIYGTEAGYLLRNSTTFRFTVIANPVEIYASGPMRPGVTRDSKCSRTAIGAAMCRDSSTWWPRGCARRCSPFRSAARRMCSVGRASVPRFRFDRRAVARLRCAGLAPRWQADLNRDLRVGWLPE
jgi:hypothetical protein